MRAVGFRSHGGREKGKENVDSKASSEDSNKGRKNVDPGLRSRCFGQDEAGGKGKGSSSDSGPYEQSLEIVGDKILSGVVSSSSNLEVRTPLDERKESTSFKISSVVDGRVLEWVEDTIGSVKLDAAIGVEASSVSLGIFYSDPNSFIFSNPKESVVHEAISFVGTILEVNSPRVKRWKRLAREKVKRVYLHNKLAGLGFLLAVLPFLNLLARGNYFFINLFPAQFVEELAKLQDKVYVFPPEKAPHLIWE
ncbi:hypothetical protein ACOSQ3_004153 [Xanthoceras sorbifolium]